MKVAAEKWQAYGNDFILVRHDLSDLEGMSCLARSVCDRHEGLGADGVVAYDAVQSTARCRIYNADGSEAEISGNGIRCLAGLLKINLPGADLFTLHSRAGVKTLVFLREDPPALWFRANMGAPDFDPSALPARVEGPAALPARLSLQRGGQQEVYLVSMGNPHCVVFLQQLDSEEWGRLGAELERHPIFPRRSNVEFVAVTSSHDVEVRMWERGVGRTYSSGTGACAAAVVSIRMGLAESPVTVHTEKGEFQVQWRPGEDVFIDGPAVPVWRGEFVWERTTATR